MIVSHLQIQAARVLGLDSDNLPDPRVPLTELGFDSLMAVEWSNQIGAAAGITIPVTLLFDYPTIDAIGGFVLNKVLNLGEDPVDVAETQESEAAESNIESLFDSIEQMSDNQVDALIASQPNDDSTPESGTSEGGNG